MGVILQTSESLKKINLKMDVLAEAALRIKENDLAIDYCDFSKGIGLILEDICVELAQVNANLEKAVS